MAWHRFMIILVQILGRRQNIIWINVDIFSQTTRNIFEWNVIDKNVMEKELEYRPFYSGLNVFMLTIFLTMYNISSPSYKKPVVVFSVLLCLVSLPLIYFLRYSYVSSCHVSVQYM